ncbi:MAG: single-stranded DNA-binding protein [Bacteroidota bacterium]
MAKTQNSVTLVGYLGADPVLRKAVNGKSYTKFRMATNSYWRKPDGSIVRKAIWHTIMIWNHLADALVETFIKGSHVMIQGSIRNEKFTGKDGTQVFFSHVVASKVTDLDR